MTIQELQDSLAKEHQRLFFDWTREVIKLAAAGLTLTVSLQSFYVRANPEGVWLLALCWVGLTVSLLSGLWVLRGQAVVHFEAMDNLRALRQDFPDKGITAALATEPLAELRPHFWVAYYVMMISFGAALLGLLLFALLNLP
jgi:hypothetical protein